MDNENNWIFFTPGLILVVGLSGGGDGDRRVGAAPNKHQETLDKTYSLSSWITGEIEHY